MHQAGRVYHTDHIDSISAWIASSIDDNGSSSENALCLKSIAGLGMVKSEAFDRHFMHQAVSVCHTDHIDSIIAWIASSFDV